MKKNTLKTTAASGILALSLCSVFAQAPKVFAADNYTPAIGGTTTFDTYLIMEEQAHVPNVTFNYTVVPGTSRTYNLDGQTLEILAGVGTPLISPAVFSPDDTSYLTPQGTDQITLDSGYKYARHASQIDFSGCSFDEPGVYRYVINASDENNGLHGITTDPETTRIMDVYVTDDSGALTVSGYVLHTDDSDISMSDSMGSSSSPEGKDKGYRNTYDSHDLTLRNSVEGNQASRDKYFRFTLNIADAIPGTLFDVDLSLADAVVTSTGATKDSYVGVSNPSSITVGSDGTASVDIYLQHGQSVKIKGLANGTSYDISETEEDYKPSNTRSEGDLPVVAASTNNTSDDSISADSEAIFLNTRDGLIPTGIMVDVLPYAIVTLLGGAGAVITMHNRRR